MGNDRNKIALFDMDGTIADYESAMKRDLLTISNEQLPDNYHSDDTPRFMRERIKLVRSRPGWWSGLPVIESGMALMGLCVEIGYKVHILSQAPEESENAWSEKFSWCKKNISPIAPDFNIALVRGGKGIYYGRVLVDDYPGYMLDWLEHRERGLGLMPITNDNEGFSHPQVVKYNSELDKWRTPELEDRLQAAFNRESGVSAF